MEICKAQGKDSEKSEYADFLAPFATQYENKSAIRSKITELYNYHKQLNTERQHQEKVKRQTKKTLIVLIGLLIMSFGLLILYQSNKRKKQRLEMQIKEEQYTHEIQQKALAGRLKQSNEALRAQKKIAIDLAKKVDVQQRLAVWGSLDEFTNEAICQKIVAMLRDKTIKRDARNDTYPELQLNDTQLHALSVATEKHFPGFEKTLTDLYPKINRDGINQCLLYLLNLEDVQIAAMLSCDYSTIKKRSLKMKEAFNTKKELRQFIRELVLKCNSLT